MPWTDDPLFDFMLHDARQQRELDRLPLCADCDDPVQADYFYLINDECICPDCLDAGYRKAVEDYV